MVPSPRLLLIAMLGLAVAALPTLVSVELWPLVLGLWGALLLGGLADAIVLARARPEVLADVPATAGVGDDLEVGVEVRHRAPQGLKLALRPEVRTPLAAGEDVRFEAPAGAVGNARLVVPAPRRGAGGLEALWSRVEGPLGLLERIERHPIGAPVAVVPNAERVRELLLAHFGAQQLGGVHVTKRVGEAGELDSLEAYQPGMDLRQVDWKSSARHQALRVRRHRLEQNQRLVLCVDTGRLMADPIHGVERLDHAIHAALLLGQVALRSGDLVGVHAYGAQPVAWEAPRGGARHMTRLRRALASLKSAPEETNHVLGLHALVGRLRRRALIVVFTEFSDPTTAELMIERVGHLARRHLVVFVALDDPAIEAPLEVRPARGTDVAAALVAGGLRSDRERVLRRLRRSGVDVVSGPPGPAALQLLERYVRIKRRGLIG
ncbi:MAG: DUF58 domain-containing protein [Myxococcota bacterium]